MKHFLRWISPLILGVVEFYFLRLATDPSRGSEWWPDFNNQLRALALTILLCYIADYYLRKFFHKYVFKKEISIGKEYFYLSSGLFMFTNVPLLIVYKLGVIEMGQPLSDFILINVIYIPLNILYYTIIRNREIAVYYQNQTLQLEKMRSQQLDTELKLLKSQYHPHFLFNALNTIYFQIDENNKQAKHSVELLSELLRYQLYDIQKKVTVKQELDYLKAYIRFQQQRMSEQLVLTEEYDEQLNTQEIHPLLFQPLVENAFKYVCGDYRIRFSLKLVENKLIFTAENSVDQEQLAILYHKKANGLGIENMKKRLQILYPAKHRLTIYPEEKTYLAELIIELTPYENKMCDNR